jgi:anti-sigma B factor antagonist
MKIFQQDGTLSASSISYLGEANTDLFQNEMQTAMEGELRVVEVDLSEVTFLDSHGLGALLMVHRAACNRHGDVPMRLLNPQPPVQQILELTRMHRIFEIIKSPISAHEAALQNPIS